MADVTDGVKLDGRVKALDPRVLSRRLKTADEAAAEN